MSGSGTASAASQTEPGSNTLRRCKSRLATPDNCGRNKVTGSNYGNGDLIRRGPVPCDGWSDAVLRNRGMLASKELAGVFF